MALFVLLRFLLLSPAAAWVAMENWESGNVTSSVGESGQCVFQVYLPDTTFPAGRVELVEQVTKNMALDAEGYLHKLERYTEQVDVLLRDVKNLTLRVDLLWAGPDEYIRLDFELLRTQLRTFEHLVSQLKESVNSSTTVFDSLYNEIRNLSLTVDQLEKHNEHNLLLVHTEFRKPQKKLEDCKKEQESITKPDIGSCDHNGIANISKPMVRQLNAALNPGYKFGGWGKDSKPIAGYESMYWYGAYSDPTMKDFYLYSDYDKLILRSSFKHHALSSGWISIGNNYVVYGNILYYQSHMPFCMAKHDLVTSSKEYKVVPNASQKYSYSYSANQNLDFAADEKGLWLLYATEETNGRMVIAKMNVTLFSIQEVWTTGVYKQVVGNAFMVCGVMYATRPVDVKTEEVFYSFDTNTGQEQHHSIHFEKFQEKYVNLDYNPTDQKLYMYNDGYYVAYELKFKKK